MFLRGRNQSFYLGFKAYHDDYDFEQAIENFQVAIEHETSSTEDSPKAADTNEEQRLEEPGSVIVRDRCIGKQNRMSKLARLKKQLKCLRRYQVNIGCII